MFGYFFNRVNQEVCQKAAENYLSVSLDYFKKMLDLFLCEQGPSSSDCSATLLKLEAGVLKTYMDSYAGTIQECGQQYFTQYKPLIVGAAVAISVVYAANRCRR